MTRESATGVVKRRIAHAFQAFGLSVRHFDRAAHDELQRYHAVWSRYRSYTMVPESLYADNLRLASLVAGVPGDVVECGVWRGGMIAGMAQVLGTARRYWLFDSFEGLPPAQPIDGEAAIAYQKDTDSAWYFDNCATEESFATRAMSLSGANRVEVVKGWFKDTVTCAPVREIALLRLDGDWYESTMTCLEALYPKLVDRGVLIVDDYYTWDGCSRAVHDYFSRHSVRDRVRQSPGGVAYIVRNS